MAKQKELEVTVESLNRKGDGYGRYENYHVEMPFTVPGDRVKIVVGRHHRGWYRAKPTEIIEQSEDRVEPRCRHAGSCGGCRLQQMDYPAQLKAKEQLVTELFPNESVRQIIGCDEPWRYRNKMEFSFSQDKAGSNYLGLMIAEGKGRVENLTECHLVSNWFTECLERVRQWWEASELPAYHFHKGEGTLRTLTLREGEGRMVMLTIDGAASFDLADRFVEACGDATVILRRQHIQKGTPTRFESEVLAGAGHIYGELLGKRFKISPTAFFQPNTRQAELIYKSALDMAGIDKTTVVYDLYCGTGTIGILAAGLAKEVVGIELNEEAVADAKENIAQNDVTNMRVICGDVGKQLAKLERPDVVIVDPPRTGLDDRAIAHLLRLQAPTVVYISCNPVTQATNVSDLKKGGYQVTDIQPVDQFPHTPHLENLVLLQTL